MMTWLNLLAGGLAGTAARYALSGVVYQVCGTQFPYGTLTVNTLGCAVIGFLAVLTEEKFLLGPSARVLLMAGFCGAFTTFSTFMLETVYLLRDGETLRAAANIGVSVALGFVALRLGMVLAELL